MRHVIDSKQVPNLINEKRILSSLNYQEAHPFIVQLQSQYCYKVYSKMKLIVFTHTLSPLSLFDKLTLYEKLKDNTFLYMALEYVQGGEMFSYINSHGQLRYFYSSFK